MKRKRQPGFFDIAQRTAKLTQMGDPLVGLNEQINWEAFRHDLNRVHEKERKSNAGARPMDVVLMFKVLVLQQLHNLSLANSYIRLLLAAEIVRGNVAANRTDPVKRAAVPVCLISPGACPHGGTDDNGYYCSKS